jgi:ABC-2 type transport system permease protein
MFAGCKSLAGDAISYGGMLEGLVIGYTLWILIREVFEDVAYTILREASEGTLEQLYMSIHGFGWVMAMKLLVRLIINLIFVIAVLYSLMLTTGRYLNLDIISVAVVISFTLLSVLGIGFIFGGLALIFMFQNTIPAEAQVSQ